MMADGAPIDLENVNDATFSRVPGKELYGVEVSAHGAAVYHGTKRLRDVAVSSHEQEAKAMNRGCEWLSWARDIAVALGRPPKGPSFCGTDNLANALVGSAWGTAKGSKHFLRLYWTIIQRVTAGDVAVGHVRDAENPTDFLTKWTTKAKLAASVEYLTSNQRAWNQRHT